MELGKPHIKIIKFLMGNSPSSPSILSKELKMRKSNVSRYCKELVSFGIIMQFKSRKLLEIRISPSFLEQYAKISNPSMESIAYTAINGKNPYIISYFADKKQFSLKDIDLPVATSKRLLSRLRSIGIFYMKEKGIYALREEAKSIARFCTSTLFAINTAQATHELGLVSSFHFCKGPSLWAVLFISQELKASKKYNLTAFDLFGQYGVKLMLTNRHYYTNLSPSLADVVIHSLVCTPGLMQTWADSRLLAYIFALIIKSGLTYQKLSRPKWKFGITEESFQRIFEFIKTEGKVTYPGFPSWTDIMGVLNG